MTLLCGDDTRTYPWRPPCRGSSIKVSALDGSNEDDERTHSLFIFETSQSPCCSKWVLGLAALASSDSVLDMQNVRPHPDFLDQNVHFNKIPGDIWGTLPHRKTKWLQLYHHHWSWSQILQQSKIQETQGERQWIHYDVQPGVTSGLAEFILGQWPGVIYVLVPPPFHSLTFLP